MVRYPVMRDALNATGRQIFFSMCEWGVDNPATWAPEVCFLFLNLIIFFNVILSGW